MMNHSFDLSSQNLKDDATSLIKKVLSSDQEVTEIITLTGGTTNTLFRCQLSGGTFVIVRVFGFGTEVFIDRDKEACCFEAIAKRGLGPRLLGTFANGRLEEYVVARSLKATELWDPSIATLIARKMRGLHSIREVPAGLGPPAPRLFEQLRLWTNLALEKCGPQYKGWDVEGLSKEVDRLKKRLQQTPSPIYLCHNDLNHLNLLLQVDEADQPIDVSLIDLEYAGWNPRGFDIGNHFCEWASDLQSPEPHKLYFDQYYPTYQQQKAWIKEYLTFSSSSPPPSQITSTIEKQGGSAANVAIAEEGLTGNGHGGRRSPSDEDIDRVIQEANEYALASHLFWGSWGLLQSCLSTLDFNFLEYANQRLTQYFKGMEKPLSSSSMSSR